MKQALWIILLFLIIISCNSNSDSENKLYRVNDYANILSETEENDLSQLVRSLEDSIGSQIIILTTNSLEGKTIERYSLEFANNWGIGRKDYDDGILITIAPSDRQVRIEVGYGLELIIGDEIAKSIIDNTMLPEFRNGDFYKGISEGTKEIINLIYDHPELVGEKWTPENNMN
ncbi:TPM domain-containing protein [Marinigracilibium pacificum]|uniref:TPM domain-containing protein n=1 Tax=Marinigracilibium pacificum TaxID=2729599 RepID=A0A848IWF8_9BACT|nr:TPM domain-containing protein [Marinigracilibium pacificum]NMM47615.1 hypothetical protein [Marinigracilibium pacificum]